MSAPEGRDFGRSSDVNTFETRLEPGVDRVERWIAYAGVEVISAVDLTEISSFARIDDRQRLETAIEEQVSWLSGLLDPDGASAFELRWSTVSSQRRLRLHVLVRCSGRSADDARTRAGNASERILQLPNHVTGGRLLAAEVLRPVLSPFMPHPQGLVEIRKLSVIAEPNRPDARVSFYVAVWPLSIAARPWTQLLAALAAYPHPLVLTVGLQPVAIGPGFTNHLLEIAANYTRLASPGEWKPPGMLYLQGTKLTADPFAVEAERLYRDAASRYAERAFRRRVLLASPEPISDGLAALAGATISPAERVDAAHRTGNLVGDSFEIGRPANDAERSIVASNLSRLEHRDWGGDPRLWGPEGLIPATVRTLRRLVDTQEAASAFRLPIAADGTVPGFPVSSPALRTRVFTETTGGAVLALGPQVNGGAEGEMVVVPLDSLTSHVLVAGTTGTGKSSTVLHLLERLWTDHRVPFLVIEPVNSDLDDYRWLATRPKFENLVVFTVGRDEVAPFRLNPFEVPVGVRIARHIANLKTAMVAAFGLWDPLPMLYQEALNLTYTQAGFYLDDDATPADVGRWPVFYDFADHLKQVVGSQGYAGEIRANIEASSSLRARSLLTGSAGPSLTARRSYPIAELLKRPAIIELAELGGDPQEQSLVMALLVNQIIEHCAVSRQAGGGLAHVTVIEEAHRLLAAPKRAGGDTKQADAQAEAGRLFANALSEVRKLGESIWIVEQIPTRLIEDAVKNTNLKILHRLPDLADRDLLGAAMHFNADRAAVAAVLPTFEAIVNHDSFAQPAHIRFPNRRKETADADGLARQPDRAELRDRFNLFRTQVPDIGDALAPYPECEPCGHKCEFRRASSRAAQSLVLTAWLAQIFATASTRPANASYSEISERITLDLRIAEGSSHTDAVYCAFIHIQRRAYQPRFLLTPAATA